MVGFVYGIYDRRTDECIYVGSTIFHIWCRWGQHISESFKKNPRQPILNTYLRAEHPYNFEPRVISAGETFETNEDLRKREQELIDEMREADVILYNARRAY